MSAGAGHQDSEGQAQEGRRAGADTCQVLLSVKSCQVLLSAGAGVGDVQQRGGGWPGAGLGDRIQGDRDQRADSGNFGCTRLPHFKTSLITGAWVHLVDTLGQWFGPPNGNEVSD